jgi:hypothetical protein
MFGDNVSPPTVTSRNRTGPRASTGGPRKSAWVSGVLEPSVTEKKPLLTRTPA